MQKIQGIIDLILRALALAMSVANVNENGKIMEN